MPVRKSPLDVAVIGGGIAGISLSIGLLKQGIPVTVYEAAVRFGEVGAGLNLSANAVQALNLIDPRLEEGLRQVSDRPVEAREPRKNRLDFRHAQGPAPDHIKPLHLLARIEDTTYNMIPVKRAGLLEELLRLFPDNVTHFNKRLESIERTADGGYDLTFKDGYTAHHNVVLGCDGVHSILRKHVLPTGSPNVEPTFAGLAAWRGLIPKEVAIKHLGEDLANTMSAFLGDRSHLVYYGVGDGQFAAVSALRPVDTWEKESWMAPSSVEEMRETFKDWSPNVVAMLEHLDCSATRGLFHLPNAETYYRGHAAVLGDAAHAMTPALGSGAGTAMEDAYVLSSLLGQVRSLDEVEAALAAYDAVRRPRTLKIARSSAEMSMIMSYRGTGIGKDLEKTSEALKYKFGWIWYEDLPAEVEQGRRIMAQHLSSTTMPTASL